MGLEPADLDVSELANDEVRGFGIARQISLRGALELLAVTYSFDAVESDHRLNFKKRGQAVSRSLSESDLKPYAPAQLAASGDWGSSITLTWVRRTRVGGELLDGFGEVPLAEDTEEYELEVLFGSSVVRTVTDLTSNSYVYTTAAQAAGDFIWLGVQANGDKGSRTAISPQAIARRIVSAPYGSGLPDPAPAMAGYSANRLVRVKIWTNR